MGKIDKKFEYRLYLASGITLWKKFFNSQYSNFFNKKIKLFEPGVLDNPDDHRFIPIGIACYDLNEINHADALLVYMKKYDSLDGSPVGTDSTWECGYAIAKGKPVIMLIEDKEHVDYYAAQWMVSFSINAILTTDKEVADVVKDHPKFVHATLLYAQDKGQMENKIIEYLKNYYRSIYSRTGIINYHVDALARGVFSRKNLDITIFNTVKPNIVIAKELKNLQSLEFDCDEDSLLVCAIERKISEYFKNNIAEDKIDSAISAVVIEWGSSRDHILDCLQHSILPPFKKVENRKQGVKKTRAELFFELYDLVTHHLTREQRFVKSESFPCEVGALVELYNWMNTYALDDVFDNSRVRQNLNTVWNEFSRRDAIFTGIIGHLLALKYSFIIAAENKDVARRIATTINDYNHTMYEGQVLDLLLTFDSETKKELIYKKDVHELYTIYIQRIYGICGGFYEAVGRLAAQLGNKEDQIMNAKQVDIISPAIGMYYGIIQMIRNDLGDYIMMEDYSKLNKGMKGQSHSDIEDGKIHTEYIIALYSPYLVKKEKEFLIRCLRKKLTKKEKLKINELLWKSGGIDSTVEIIVKLIEHVKVTLLTQYHETPTRMKWMFDLVDITKEILVPFKRQAIKYGWIKYEYDPELVNQLAGEIISLETKTMKQRFSELEKLKREEY